MVQGCFIFKLNPGIILGYISAPFLTPRKLRDLLYFFLKEQIRQMKQQIDILLTECAQRRKERGAPPPTAKKRPLPVTPAAATPAGMAGPAAVGSRPTTPMETPKGRGRGRGTPKVPAGGGSAVNRPKKTPAGPVGRGRPPPVPG